jgi:dipeptidyl aminopeptidase/acylaminoacyl peptidase
LFKLLCALLCLTTAAAWGEALTKPPPTIEELFSEPSTIDAAMSPSGRYLAAITRRTDDDLLMVFDLETGQRKVIQRTGFSDATKNVTMHMANVYWKTDERLLLRVTVRRAEGVTRLRGSDIAVLGDRLFAINRDGSKVTVLLGEERIAEMAGAFDLGSIGSFLPHDPTHILMVLVSSYGNTLYKVDLDSGRGTRLERPSYTVIGWWLDQQGNPVVRMTYFSGSIHFSRKVGEDWKKFHSKRLRETTERDDFQLLAASDRPGKFYVLARPPGRDRIGIYLYDLENNAYGDPVAEHPKYDLYSGAVARDGTKLRYYCHVANALVCEFVDPAFNSHMKGLLKYFEETASISIYDASEDGKAYVLYVDGPRVPPAFYYYLTEKRSIEYIGPVRNALADKALPQATVISYQARDGRALTGYLTAPATGSPGLRLPLVMFPHGGPEVRDQLKHDAWVQYFVSRGYAVFQPNYRGSGGLGKAFAESGYGEWGRKMQDDITDGLKDLVARGVVDPDRVCIVGASYGGYAALAGAALTPDLYQCSVSVAGVSELADFAEWRKRNWGRDSEVYQYSLRSLGDPDTDENKLRAVSPALLAAKITIPVLLVHGSSDGIVPIGQSNAMKKALDKAGNNTRLITLSGEGHSYWSKDNEMHALSSIGDFLWKHLGPGMGITAPPVVHAPPKPNFLPASGRSP